jgi:DNA-binding NarL/FixJ family response regulator
VASREIDDQAQDNDVVLIVEDDELTARAVSRLVQSLGLVAQVAPRAREALDQLASADRLRALVVDLRLPDGDGFWVAEAARRRTAALPIVILTGAMSSDAVNHSFRLGAQYLCKPLAPQDIASLRLFLLGAPPQPVVERLAQWASDKQLSPRQTEILTFTLAGLERDAIAERLGTTVQAVDEHIARLLKRLRARDLQEVVRMLRHITQAAAPRN